MCSGGSLDRISNHLFLPSPFSSGQCRLTDPSNRLTSWVQRAAGTPSGEHLLVHRSRCTACMERTTLVRGGGLVRQSWSARWRRTSPSRDLTAGRCHFHVLACTAPPYCSIRISVDPSSEWLGRVLLPCDSAFPCVCSRLVKMGRVGNGAKRRRKIEREIVCVCACFLLPELFLVVPSFPPPHLSQKGNRLYHGKEAGGE